MENIHKYIEGCRECKFYNLICKHDIEPSYDEKLTHNEKILEEIETFTQFNNNTSKFIIDDYMEKLKKMYFKLCKLKTNEYIFITRSYYYVFSKFSEAFNLEVYYDELTSENRYGKCHDRSFMFAKMNDKSNLLTGYINGTNLHILHSVVELNIFGKDYICDWTKNLVMSKQDYIKLTNYKILSKISHNQILEDSEMIEDLNLKNCLKGYLLFRDELTQEYNNKIKTLC